MKRILILSAFILSAFISFAQTGNDTTKYTYYRYQYGQRFQRLWADSVLNFPSDTTFSKYGLARKGTTLYVGNGSYWTAVTGGGGGGTGTVTSVDGGYGIIGGPITSSGTLEVDTTISDGLVSKDRLNNFLALKVNISDTSTMLSPYLRKADTSTLSNRINLKLNISDTSSMLSAYLRKTDTVTLSNRINLKLNISDTSAMLSPYLRKVDTVTLSNRINAKFNTSDTTGKWLYDVAAGSGISIDKTNPQRPVISASGSGISTLNTLTASTQTFATGTSGSDFNISSATSTHTFNLPSADTNKIGKIDTLTQRFKGPKSVQVRDTNSTTSVIPFTASLYERRSSNGAAETELFAIKGLTSSDLGSNGKYAGSGYTVGVFKSVYTTKGNVGFQNLNKFAGYLSDLSIGTTAYISDFSHFIARSPTGTVSSGTNVYGMYLEAQSGASFTNSYGVYQAGTSDKNYFGGLTSFGTTSFVSNKRVTVNSVLGSGTLFLDGQALGTSDNFDLQLYANNAVRTYIRTDGRISVRQSNEPFYDWGNRQSGLGFPVASIRPNGTNLNMALDIFPNGTPSNYLNNGLAWIDVCNKDANSSGSTPVRTARIGVSDSSAVLGAYSFVSETAKPLHIIMDNTGSKHTGIVMDTAGKIGINENFTPSSNLEFKGSFGGSITTVTTSTTLDVTHYTVLCDATSGNITITLPSAASAIRRIYTIKKIDSSGNSVSFTTAEGTQTITTQWAGKQIQCNGSAFYIIGSF